MSRLGILFKRRLAPAVLCALGLVACGSQNPAKTPPAPIGKAASAAPKTHTLYIYSGLPHNGPQAADSRQIEQGIEFALDQPGIRHRVWSDGITYQIKYRALSDSTPQRPARSRSGKKHAAVVAGHGWNPMATVASAETAARNPETVAYVGDLNSGATELSLPILNQAGIVQLTPGSGYPGLTDKTAYTPQPNRYYPQSRETLLRLVPSDTVEASAIVSWLKAYPTCHTVAAAAFGPDKPSPEAAALVDALEVAARSYKLEYFAAPPPGNNAKTYLNYAGDLAHKGVSCFVLTGGVTRAAVAFTTALRKALPAGSVIVGTAGFCNRSWSDAKRGGVPAYVATSLYCATPVLPLRYYLNGRRFRSKYLHERRKLPTAYNYLGYLAGSLVLKAIGDVGRNDSRSQVMFNLVQNGASADLATYTFDSNGDLSGQASTNYGLDRIAGGIPRFYKVLAPQK